MTETYTSQLKGWAVDRALNASKDITFSTLEEKTDALIASSKKLVDYIFSEEEAENAIRERILDEEYNQKMVDAINLKVEPEEV